MEQIITSKIISAIIWLGFISAIFFAYYFYLRFRNKERMMLIERGADIGDIYKKKEKRRSWELIAFTIIGITIGISLGIVLVLNIDVPEIIALMMVVSSSLFFGAVGIILGSKLEKKKELNG